MLINSILLALCAIIAWAIYKVYMFVDNWLDLLDMRKNEIFTQKVKRVKNMGVNYYLDLMLTNPRALAEKLARYQTKKLIKNNQIEQAYKRLEA